jgi:hypothetical protein
MFASFSHLFLSCQYYVDYVEKIYEKQKKTKQKHPLKMKYMKNKRKQNKNTP